MHKLFFDNPAATTFNKWRNIALGFFLCVFWVMFIQHILLTLYPFSERPPQDVELVPGKYLFFITCIVAPIWEELAYRYGPISIAKHFGKELVMPVIVISSATFGWGHGQGAESILRQGVMGFIFSWVYIKNGYSVWSSIILHMSWNVFCTMEGSW